MTEKDSLDQRIRDGLLFDSYGMLLTKRQQRVCEMILSQDLSFSEAGEKLGVSRQGAHDLVTRARERMEEYESAFGLVAFGHRLDMMKQSLDENRERLPEDFYSEFKRILEAEVPACLTH